VTLRHDRRLFLRFLGAGVTGALTGSLPLGPLYAQSSGIAGDPPFTPILPSTRDQLRLPREYSHDILVTWGDALPGTNARFGYNADYTAFTPRGTDAGVLFVNHEYASIPDPDAGEMGVYTQTFPLVLGHEWQMEDEMRDVGASVLDLRRGPDGRWTIAASPITRRYDAFSPMRASGPALANVSGLAGTFANCSGCQTPWGTVLTCEENVQDVVTADVDTRGRGVVGGRYERDGSHYGWVVEIDPLDPAWTPVKHTMLGRFRHENVAVRAETGRPIAAYMGDDRINGHVYRFVSDAPYAAGGETRGSLLSRGKLFAAQFNADGTGEWRELAGATPLRPNEKSVVPEIPAGATTLGQVYADLGAIVTDAFRASNLIGATPTGRPEDLEIHPIDGSVYIAFTDAATAPGRLHSNIHGEIWRIVEDGDGTGTRFTWMRWKAGGPNDPAQGGHVFAAPDNLAFDPAGNLWVVSDISTVRLNADRRYTAFRNNGMFFVPTSGPDSGVLRQFASAPCEAELTGPSWSADRSTMFLSVQHPGEASGMRKAGMRAPRGSNWPSGRLNEPPRPAVVMIRRA
jgi:hypothetical protein